MGELSKRKTSDLHPNESGGKKKKRMFLHITLALDRLHSIAAGFEDRRFFSFLTKGKKKKKPFQDV